MSPTAASAIIIRPSDGRVLVGQRSLSKKLSPGEWETIGGSIEGEETLEECINREIKEELNVNVKTCAYFKDYATDNGITAVFIITLVGEPSFSPDDFEEIRWVTREEVEKLEFAIDCQKRLLDYFNSR